MKVLIIGGARFLGYHLVRRLLRDGHELTLFNRGLTPDDFGHAVGRVHGDRTDYEGFRKKLGGENFEAVVDMVAYKGEDSRSAVETFKGRTGHYVHISSGAVYFVTRDFPCPLREEDFDREVLPRPARRDGWWDYGAGKRQCEEVISAAVRDDGFPATILRLPIVQGERDYTLRAYSYFLRLADGRPVILPDGGLCPATYIYQDDVIRTIAGNLGNTNSIGQAYNLAQPEIVTLRALVLKAAAFMGLTPEIADIPSDVLKRAGLGTDFSPFSLRRPFVMASNKAERDLGFSATPFDTWMGKTVRWFREEYRGGVRDIYATRDKEVSLAEKYREAVGGIA
jgi:nucleoside-diphosphate-sugar epimerase